MIPELARNIIGISHSIGEPHGFGWDLTWLILIAVLLATATLGFGISGKALRRKGYFNSGLRLVATVAFATFAIVLGVSYWQFTPLSLSVWSVPLSVLLQFVIFAIAIIAGGWAGLRNAK